MNTSVAIMLVRMKPLPLRHRIAHLRAVLRQPSASSVRREELAASLHDEISARPKVGLSIGPELAACAAGRAT